MIHMKIFIPIALILLFSNQAVCDTNDLIEIKDYAHTLESSADYLVMGNDIKIGIWESAKYGSSKVDDTRPELSGRIIILDDYSDISSHATNVALILGSDSTSKYFKGMAPCSELYSSDTQNNMYDELCNSDLDISTNSYGLNHSLSDYTTAPASQISSLKFDAAIRDSKIITFKSAGNEGNDGHPSRYHTISPPGTAKNIITVGAVKNDEFDNVTDFTSYGPCLDGRIKPEIVATGERMIIDENDQSPKRGTSYATPVVSGSSALILEHWKNTHPNEDMLPSTMKALLVHTANNDGNGPTYRYGYGMLDTKESLDLVELDTVNDTTIIQDDTTFAEDRFMYTNQTVHIFTVPPNTGELKITLAWSDKEGVHPYLGKDLKNDLDLTAYKTDGTSDYYYPWTLDPSSEENSATRASSPTYDYQNYEDHLNPLEQVQIEDPSPGKYSIIIDGDIREGPQSYSLIITTKSKVEIHSDKEGAKIYVNNPEGYGYPDGVIENEVAEVCAYNGANTIHIESSAGGLTTECDVSSDEVLQYEAYFNSYPLELKSGSQFFSLPFDAMASDIISTSDGNLFRVENEGLTLTAMSLGSVLERGECYLIDCPADCSINVVGQSNGLSTFRIEENYGFVGAPPSTMRVLDFISSHSFGLVDSFENKVIYRYDSDTAQFELLDPDDNVNPGESYFVCTIDTIVGVYNDFFQ